MNKIGRNETCHCGSGKKYKLCCLGRAIPATPLPDAHMLCKMGDNFFNSGAYDEALSYYQQAVALNPSLALAHFNIGVILQHQGKLDDAESSYRKAITLRKNLDKAYSNLGIIAGTKSKLDESINYFHKAIAIEPNCDGTYYNLSLSLSRQWRLEEQIEALKKAIKLAKSNHTYHSDLLFHLHYSSIDDRELYSEHLKWYEQHGNAAKLMSPSKGWNNILDPDRRLRIGYVSGDFCMHPVGYFFQPLLERHDRTLYEIYCYSDVDRYHEDKMTIKFKQHTDAWRRIAGKSDFEVAEMIRCDRIDILIDLAGHTDNNRLRVFAMRSAPLQVTWLGYPNTTGLQEMDYRITDEIADPLEISEKLHTERLLRLEHGFLCYSPSPHAPDVESLPALTNGYLTFGSFNSLLKVNLQVIEVWSKIICRVPNSRLIMKYKGFADETCRRRVLDAFAMHGISPDRLQLVAYIDNINEHLALYNRIDIALDPFPYNGTTTTCDALWMGVHVLTLSGSRHSARVGASILSRLGLNELITYSKENYVETAVKLAADMEYLSSMRTEMRGRMANSPLCDSMRFTRDIESTLREIWKHWCANALSQKL